MRLEVLQMTFFHEALLREAHCGSQGLKAQAQRPEATEPQSFQYDERGNSDPKLNPTLVNP